jgi:hypothetical protein
MRMMWAVGDSCSPPAAPPSPAPLPHGTSHGVWSKRPTLRVRRSIVSGRPGWASSASVSCGGGGGGRGGGGAREGGSGHAEGQCGGCGEQQQSQGTACCSGTQEVREQPPLLGEQTPIARTRPEKLLLRAPSRTRWPSPAPPPLLPPAPPPLLPPAPPPLPLPPAAAPAARRPHSERIRRGPPSAAPAAGDGARTGAGRLAPGDGDGETATVAVTAASPPSSRRRRRRSCSAGGGAPFSGDGAPPRRSRGGGSLAGTPRPRRAAAPPAPATDSVRWRTSQRSQSNTRVTATSSDMRASSSSPLRLSASCTPHHPAASNAALRSSRRLA